MYVPCYEKSDKDKINVWLKREERSKWKKNDNEKKKSNNEIIITSSIFRSICNFTWYEEKEP